jgi:hypothetical protein
MKRNDTSTIVPTTVVLLAPMYVIQRRCCFISYVCKARPYGNHLALLVGVRKKEGRGLEIFTEERRGFLREKRLEERRV